MHSAPFRTAARSGLAVVLAGTLAVPAYGIAAQPSQLPQAHAAAGFPDADVIPGSWYVPYVQWAVENDVIQGYPDGTFGPEDPVTRGQVALMLCRSAGADAEAGAPAADNATPWTDVADGAYYTHAMNWAYEKGIFTGYDGKVRPDDNITREEIAAVIARYASEQLGLNTDTAGYAWPANTFETELLTPYAASSFLWTAVSGIMSGNANPDGTYTLAPQQATTRAQFAKVITTLVRDVAPTWPEHGIVLHDVAPADLTPSSIAVVARNAQEENITPYCEFSLDTGTVWTQEPTFTGLEPASYHVVYARLKGSGATPAQGGVVSYEFRTNEAYGTLSAPDDVVAETVTDTTAEIAAYMSNGGNRNDVTRNCEFALVEEPPGGGTATIPELLLQADVEWQDSPAYADLKPATHYYVFARMKATGGWLASPVEWTDFTTHKACQGEATVYEYAPVTVTTRAAVGLDQGDSAKSVVVSCDPSTVLTDEEKAAVEEAAKQLAEYQASMEAVDAENADDGWDRVTALEERTFTVLVQKGSHKESYANETEFNALKDYGKNVAFTEAQLAVTGRDCKPAWTIVVSDGKMFSSKKEAWDYCQDPSHVDKDGNPVEIATIERADLGEGTAFSGSQTREELLQASGISEDAIWCLEGETILKN